MARMRIGVIGAGMAFKPHALALRDMEEEVDLACVVAPSAATRASVVRDYGFPVADTVDALWRDSSLDAVLILTPPATHSDLVTQAAHAGKAVLLEKPLEITVERAEQLVQTCAQHGTQLGIVFQHRFRESAARLRTMLDAEALGELVSVSIQIPWWRPQSYYDVPGRGTRARDGGGVLLTQAIHTLDLALSFMGTVDSVFARAVTSAVHRMETEDLVSATFRCTNGAIGSLHATTACYPGCAEQIRLMGTKASACIEGDSLQVRFHDGRSIDYGSAAALGAGADPMAFSHLSHLSLLRNFVSAVRAGETPVPGAREALEVQYFIAAMLASSAGGAECRVRTA